MADYSAAYAGADQSTKSKEERLLDLLGRIRTNTAGYFAVHLHLSELRPSHRQPHFMRMAQRSIDTLAAKQDVQAVNSINSDVIMLCRNVPVDEVDDVVFRVRALFNEDPLTQTEDGSVEDRFSTWYDLSQQNDFKAFEDAVSSLVKTAEAMKAEQAETMSSGRASKAMAGEPLAPEMLDKINQKLLEARIGDLVRRQPAVLVHPNKVHELAFREHYIAMGELRERIAPKVNIFASHWLFQYLSETIDARMLEVLSRIDFAGQDSAVSVNLNISTVMARPFQTFHSIVGEHTNKVVVEIQAIDAFSDMNGYTFARDWLQERGYRVLLDGLNPLTLHFFDASKLGSDYIKISWGPEVKGGLGADQSRQIRDVVSKMPPGGVVLARVDSEEGVSWGLDLGILCFQGHFIDRVVAAMSTKGLL